MFRRARSLYVGSQRRARARLDAGRVARARRNNPAPHDANPPVEQPQTKSVATLK